MCYNKFEQEIYWFPQKNPNSFHVRETVMYPMGSFRTINSKNYDNNLFLFRKNRGFQQAIEANL